MPAAAESFEYFRADVVAESIVLCLQVYELAQTVGGLKNVRDGALKLAGTIRDDVTKIAIETARLADELIIAKIHESQARNRPASNTMETHIVSMPDVLGSVKVALMAELDRIINPQGGYDEFWRAQEYGTGSESGGYVPSQEGRIIVGIYSPSANPPDADLRSQGVGQGVGTDAAFIDSRGGLAARGVISVELPARHFLTDGAAEAAIRWKAAIEEAQVAWIKRIKELQQMVADALGGAGGTRTWIIKA